MYEAIEHAKPGDTILIKHDGLVHVKPVQMEKNVPLELYEARNAVQIAKWFGAAPVDIAQIFPSLGNFASAGWPTDLGFLR